MSNNRSRSVIGGCGIRESGQSSTNDEEEDELRGIKNKAAYQNHLANLNSLKVLD